MKLASLNAEGNLLHAVKHVVHFARYVVQCLEILARPQSVQCRGVFYCYVREVMPCDLEA
jgi:hypothetical protein